MQGNRMLHCWNSLSQTTTINRHLRLNGVSMDAWALKDALLSVHSAPVLETQDTFQLALTASHFGFIAQLPECSRNIEFPGKKP